MLRQSHVPASKASPAQKFEGGLFQKLFKGCLFCFLVHSVGRYIFELSAREINLLKKRCVMLSALLKWLKLVYGSFGHSISAQIAKWEPNLPNAMGR